MTMHGPDWEQVAAEADEGLAGDVGQFIRRHEAGRVERALIVYQWRDAGGDLVTTVHTGADEIVGLGLARIALKIILDDWHPCEVEE